MAHNVSQRQRRNMALKNRVGDLAPGWRLELGCGKCGRQRVMPVNRMPPDLKVQEVLLRLRCIACRQPPSRVLLLNGSRGSRRWEVRLEGPGAYG